MMYIIYNNDGSIKYKNLVDFIQQGNNNVNKILISIIGREPTAYSITGHFTLPDGTKLNISSDTTDSVTIGDEVYYGVVLSLSSEITALSGLVRVNIVAIDNETDDTLVTYQSFLTVNSGAAQNVVAMMSQAEYQNLISQINRNTSNNETILTFVYPQTIPTASNYQNGQVIYVVPNNTLFGTIYQKVDGSWAEVMDLQDYYNKTEINSFLATKQNLLTRDSLETAQLQYSVGFDAQGNLRKGASESASGQTLLNITQVFTEKYAGRLILLNRQLLSRVTNNSWGGDGTKVEYYDAVSGDYINNGFYLLSPDESVRYSPVIAVYNYANDKVKVYVKSHSPVEE